MYFVFEMDFVSNKRYIADMVRDYAEITDIDVEVIQAEEKIVLVFAKDDAKIESFLLGLESRLPASVFLKKSRHFFSEEKPLPHAIDQVQLPVNIALCPECQKEMFDVSSRRYYYPFTSCNHCGTQHPFVNSYPFTRENTGMKFLVPCEACLQEQKKNPLRRDYPLISCVECGIPLRMRDKNNERYANDKGSYRKLFEVAAKAVAKGKTVLMKTPNGYRRFYKPSKEVYEAQDIAMMTQANALNKHLMMVTQEFNALLSIERPIVRVATKSEETKALFGTTVLVKYPDDGMSILLAKELANLGLEFVMYAQSDAAALADFLIDFDIPTQPQQDTKLFINQDMQFFVEGERIIYPAYEAAEKNVLCVANGLAAVPYCGGMLMDTQEHFDAVDVSCVYRLEEDDFSSGHSCEKPFRLYSASMLSVLAEHHLLREKVIGIHFDEALHFLYYNQKEVIDVVPPNPFDAHSMFEHIATLREGSDRLVTNYQKAYPEIFARLEDLQEDADLFTVTAIMLGLEDESFEGISAKALGFLGKGGIQIDTRVKDNRFDNYAFLASIMSYLIAGVESELLCYSIYESFGDYIAEIIGQLAAKTKAQYITLTGETLANQALYARIQRHLGRQKLLFPKAYPIGASAAVHGAIYLR